MANKKITELPVAVALTGTEPIEIVQGGVNKQATTQDIANLGGTGGGHVIEDEGTPLTQRTKLNFVGSGVTVTDDSGDDATVVTIGGGGGSGDVVGPGSSINNNVVFFDGVTGKLIKDSGLSLSGSNTGDQDLSGKQDTLVSGTNIKTVNGNSVLGSGDIDLIDDAIVDGVAKAPSQNAVFDALVLKADLASPALTGNPTAPTQALGDNSTKIATTAYVDNTLNSLGGDELELAYLRSIYYLTNK